MPTKPDDKPRVVELFAGVGGFRVALERSGWDVVWANQWEPGSRVQHAFDCYASHYPHGAHLNSDIAAVMDAAESGALEVPDHELLVGGWPCQDYSVAKTLNKALGIEGKKGVLWWEIHRLLRLKRPPYLFLENVDRLLKSPASRRGRDFAIMLTTLGDLGYEVEWRVVNAADYGFPQKRRRVYLVGRLAADRPRDPNDVLYEGTLARALPVFRGPPFSEDETFRIDGDPVSVSDTFGSAKGDAPFRNAGYFSHRRVWTADLGPAYDGPRVTLGEILEPSGDVPESFYVPESQLPSWEYLKGGKREQRHHRATGTPYFYSEGPIPFPDRTDGPARTILTAEGGSTPSRFKHIIRDEAGRYRRLTPRELERLNGFPDDWTAIGVADSRRAFMMGNALVVGVVERIGRVLAREVRPDGARLAIPIDDRQPVAP